MDALENRLDARRRGRSFRVHPESDVLLHGEMRKQAVVLRDVRQPARLRRTVDAGCRVEPDLGAESDEAFLRPVQSREASQDRRLAGSRWTEQHQDTAVAGFELQIGPHRDGRRVSASKGRYEAIGHARPDRRCKR